MGREQTVCSRYRKEDGSASLRAVNPRSVSRAMLHAEDRADGAAKWSRFDRVYDARPYEPAAAPPSGRAGGSLWATLRRVAAPALARALRAFLGAARSASVRLYALIAPRDRESRDAQIILLTDAVSLLVILAALLLLVAW